MITAWIADPDGPLVGAGKTLGMVSRLLRHKSKNRAVLTNFGFKERDGEVKKAAMIKLDAELTNVAVGIDEMMIWLDSRRSQSAKNLMISYFIVQTRKRHVNLHYTAQMFDSVDKRLKLNTDYIVVCRRMNPGAKAQDAMFYYQAFNKRGRLLERFMLRGSKYYPHFDTEETISDGEEHDDEK